MSLQVGSTIYKRNGDPVAITGETKLRWIIGGEYEWNQAKIKKSAMCKGNSGEHWIQFFVNQQDALDCKFASDNSYRIGSMVQGCKDGVIMRKIAALVGYQEEV